MPNSIAIANVEIQLQDGLQSSIPPVIFRTVPPVNYPSNYQVTYGGYTKINPGGSFAVVSTIQCPFVYIRNAGQRGVILVEAIGDSLAGQMQATLTVGGVFLWGNPTTPNAAIINYMTSVIVRPATSDPVTVEWMAAE